MNSVTKRMNGFGKGPRRQRGALTLFSAILILVLMTLMLLYAARVGIFETRVSGNEQRQKAAFNVAEAAIDQGIMFMLANAGLILSSQVDAFPDGAGGTTRDGWFAAGAQQWGTCTATETALANHPCGGDVPAPIGAFFYDNPTTNTGVDSLPLDESDFPADSTARLTALMCFVNLGAPGAGCLGSPTIDEEPEASLVLWMMGYGYSDCTDVTDTSTCTGAATVAKPVSTFKNLKGSPSVPLVTKSTFPPTGTAEIVGNPNGGGVGVPLTTWINNNNLCPPATPIISSGSWQTCELEEWYHTSDLPPGTTCTDNNCFCGPGGNDTDYFLSWRTANNTNINIDIIIDDDFPCDLFDFYFGTPRALYPTIKANATVLTSCAGLGPGSTGFIWISGPTCTINAGTQIGSPGNPLILVSAAGLTKINGGATIYGVLYIFDGEDPNAELETTGGATVYGAVIVDAVIDKMQGTFQIVHAGGVLARAAGFAGIGSVNGGWRDFGLPAITWPVPAP